MNLINIKIEKIEQSKTNVAGRNKGPEFNELVASIKEKGILVPILIRTIKRTGIGPHYEVIAGGRRLAASKEAGLETIPAQVIEMDDTEAREAQIIENLQRKNIHPLDEGNSYRELLETKKGSSIFDISAKMAKSEDYIRQRLLLTNLIAPVADAYRAGKINDGHAVLIARLSTGDQTKALKAATDRYNLMTIKELKEWIESEIYSPMEFQPWVGVKELEEAVGKCVECQPNRLSLFGPVKEGFCTDLKCWQRKMQNYINFRQKAGKLTRIASEYGVKSVKGVKVLSQSEYIVIKNVKEACESTHGAIIVQGNNIGREIKICSNRECKTHFDQRTEYALSPNEKKRRKEERLKAIKEKEAKQKRLTGALAKVKWPLSAKHLEALLALALEQASSNLMRNVAKRHELKVEKTKSAWGSDYFNYGKAVKEFAETLGNTEKARLIFELLIDTGYDSLRAGIGKI
jgi:ParB family chromosome partitioning protein